MKGTCSNLTRRICSEAGFVCGWCDLGTAMETCGKCGKPVNHRLHGMCMTCRYEEKMERLKEESKKACRECSALFVQKKITQVFCSEKCQRRANRRRQSEREKALHKFEPRICAECGAVYTPWRRNMIRCEQCRADGYKATNIAKMKSRGRGTGICVKCGKTFHAGYSPETAKCPGCLEAEKIRPALPPHIDSPTRTTMARPGGWTGPIVREEPDKPVKAKIRIPAGRLPAPPFPPTKPLRIKLEPPQTAYEYEAAQEAQETQEPKMIVPIISGRKRP